MVISVSNLKGGCGKTTISTNLAVAFANQGKSVCLVDTDLDQGSSLEWGAARTDDDTLSKVAVIGIGVENITSDVIALEEKFDIIIIDGVPQLKELADRAMLAANLVVIPVKTSLQDLRAMEKYLLRFREVKKLKQQIGKDLKALMVINEADPRSKIYVDILEAVASYEEQYIGTIHTRTIYRDAFSYGRGATEKVNGKLDKKAVAEINTITNKILSYA